MDIEIVSTGRIFKQVDPTLGTILCEALPQQIRWAKPTPPAPMQPPVFIADYGNVNHIDARLVKPHIRLVIMGEVSSVFSGPVREADKFFKGFNYGGTFGVPEAVVATYAKCVRETIEWLEKEIARNEKLFKQTEDEGVRTNIGRLTGSLNDVKRQR